MSENKEEIEVVLDEDANQAPEPEVVVAEEEEAPVIEPNDAIEKMRRQLEEERRARAEAEMSARQAREQATKAYSEASDANIQIVHSAINQIKTQNGILTAQYAEAMNSSDYERAAQIQAEISQNATKLVHLENGVQEMQKQPSRLPVEPVPPPPRGDILDQIINSVTPRSASWLKANRDNLPDQRSINRMFRAHEDAVDDGLEPDSDAYFRFIEQRLGINKPSQETAAARPTPRSVAPAAAPVNRGTTSRNNVVRLSPAEAETAKMLGMTEKEYAQHKIALQREGKLS